MGYAHIDNLYSYQDILLFKECWALEKVHGTSAHLKYTNIGEKINDLYYFSGGSKHEKFLELFDHNDLLNRFAILGHPEITVYGEAYGGKLQGMSGTYGTDLKFIVFDVLIGDHWLSVPKAHDVATKLGLEFVPYRRIDTSLASIDRERDAPSEVAIRRGVAGDNHIREGVVLRPIEEVRKNSGKRIICKHKRDEFRETKTPRVVDPAKTLRLKDAEAIASEYVVLERLKHIVSKMPEGTNIEQTGDVIANMLEDVHREADAGTVFTQEADKAISRATALLFKKHLQEKLHQIELTHDVVVV